jgi:outer membrane protein assembly factor BamB
MIYTILQQRGRQVAAKSRAYLPAVAVAAVTLALPNLVHAASDSGVFDAGTTYITDATTGITKWVRGIGIISLLVCALIWMATGKQNWRWIAGAFGGLIVAALATKIAAFFI